MTGVSQSLVQEANRRGMLLFVDTDGRVKSYRWRTSGDERFDRLLSRYRERIKVWLISDAVTIE